MDPKFLDTVLYTLAFVVPGFVWLRTAQHFFIEEQTSKEEAEL